MSIEDLRAAALSDEVRFEVVEHKGRSYAVRQTTPRISKALAAYKEDAHGRTVELVIQCTHAAEPVLDAEGKQQTEEAFVHATEPVLDEKKLPVMEPMLDPKGRPIVFEGRPLMQAKLKPKVDENGSSVFELVKRPKFSLGKKVFARTDFDALMEAPNDRGSLIEKIANAAVKVNDREEATDRAKKS